MLHLKPRFFLNRYRWTLTTVKKNSSQNFIFYKNNNNYNKFTNNIMMKYLLEAHKQTNNK